MKMALHSSHTGLPLWAWAYFVTVVVGDRLMTIQPLSCVPDEASEQPAVSETVCAITAHHLASPIFSFADGVCEMRAAGAGSRAHVSAFSRFSPPNYTQVTNIAQGKPYENSLVHSSRYLPQYANDASEATVFINHASIARPWWMVDLQDLSLVDRVEILPRQETWAYRFYQVEIRVGSTPRVGEDFSEWPLLGFYEGPYSISEGRLTFANETKLCGRYVVVQRVAAQVDYLELADVKVFVHLP